MPTNYGENATLSTEEYWQRIILNRWEKCMEVHVKGDFEAYYRAVDDLGDAMNAYEDDEFEEDMQEAKPIFDELQKLKKKPKKTPRDVARIRELNYQYAKIKFRALSKLMMRSQMTAPIRVRGIIDDKTEDELWSKTGDSET